MESISLQQKEIAKDLLEQIRGAIDNFILKNPELPSNSGVFCDNIVFSGRDSFSFTLLALRRERLYERE